MEYTDIEKQALSMMQRTDFKNLSKNDVVGIFAQLNQLRPEVATEIVSQFPEFAALVRTSMVEYRQALDAIIESDDRSLDRYYSTADTKMDSDAQSRQQFYDMAEKVQTDLSKCLDEPDLSPEERKDILDREMEILKIVGEKDTEIRESEKETMNSVGIKDSEKREFNWGLIKIVTELVVGFGVGFGVGKYIKD